MLTFISAHLCNSTSWNQFFLKSLENVTVEIGC